LENNLTNNLTSEDKKNNIENELKDFDLDKLNIAEKQWFDDKKKPNSKKDDKLAEQEKQNLFNKAKNEGKFDTHIHNIVIAFLYSVGFVMISLIVIRGIHFVAPIRWRWLTNDDCHQVERIIFSGAIVTVIGKLSSRYKLDK